MGRLSPVADEMLTIWHDLNSTSRRYVVAFMRDVQAAQRNCALGIVEAKPHDTIPCPPPDPCNEDEPTLGDYANVSGYRGQPGSNQ